MTRLRFRRRADFVLAVVDVAVALLTAYVAFVLRFEGETIPHHYLARYEILTIGLAPVWVVAGRTFGLYRRAVLRPGESVVEAAFEASIAAGVVLYLVNAVGLGGKVSRAWIALVVLGLLLIGVAARVVLQRTRRMLVPFGIALERYAIYGDDAAARRLQADLTRAPGAPFVITELISDQLPPDEIARRAMNARLDGLIVPAGHEPTDVGRLAGHLSGLGIEVLLAPGLGQLDLRVASLTTFHGVPLLRVAGVSPRRRAARQPAHRDLSRGVAILGTRGIPANYGGFETFAERLALHLANSEIAVTVYCRSHYATGEKQWHGVHLVTLPTIRSKHLDTPAHTALSALHLVLTSRVRDVVLCNAANAPVLPLLRLVGCRVVMNVDGLEWRRGKWGIAGRSWYRLGEWMSVRFASVLVTDANEVRTYYRIRHDTDSVMIPYGADTPPRGLPLPDEVHVRPDNFLLYVSRWEPENNPVLVARAHHASDVAIPLVMLGRATYDDELDRAVRSAASDHTLLPGAIYGDGYLGLQSNALAYIHATEVGGTHPALIEAMGAGNLCLVLDTPENREVAGEVAWMFADEDELIECLRRVAALGCEELTSLRLRTRAYAAQHYSWKAVGDAYLALMRPALPSTTAT
ncbi:MAG TPA: DUF1972 domain-containing protein [Mycobacteriales bacterium]|nr:DUF1972 domain-containing protein [Mycobacteriales bacterium]